MSTIASENHLQQETDKHAGIGSSVAPGRGVVGHQYGEGPIARSIEEQTARLPSDTFLMAASASILTSLALQIAGERHKALFVGQWAAPFLLLGIYNKIVKLHGSE